MKVNLILDPVFRLLRGRRWYKLNTFIFYKTLKNLEYGAGGDPISSGERNVITPLRIKQTPTIIDCGANLGQYAEVVISELQDKDFRLYCFEPSFQTFNKVKSKLDDLIELGKVHVLNEALSSSVGEATLFSDASDSKYASLSKLDLEHTGKVMDKEETIKTNTLDSFLESEGLQKVDLLKLDVEGHELSVLQGGKNALENGVVEQIQFEFGKTNIDTRTFFKDFYQLLSSNYKFYRVLSWGLEPLPDMYLESQEIFYCTNFVARWRG